jgi:photosystem II stability/assembly factor-like uncharacterized protein
MVPPRLVAAAVLVLALGGCSLVDAVRRPPPPRPAAVPPVAEFELRSRTVRVPEGFRLQTMSFLTAHLGAALFTRCSLPKRRVGNHNDCTARLFVTTDGGDSWAAREHPEPVADGHQVRLGPAGQIALLAEPRSWYVSPDGGRTFRPAATEPLAAEYQICCDQEPDREVLRSGRPLRAAPDLSGPPASMLARPGRDLWVAAATGTAVSTDDGRSWTTVAVPGRAPAATRVTLQASADNEDVWLLAGTAAPQAYPQIWQLDDGAWLPVEAEGHPADSISTAPVGNGALAVSTRAGIGLVAPGQQWQPTDWPARGHLRTLSDGTLLARDDLTGAWWLGSGGAGRRDWLKIELRPRP